MPKCFTISEEDEKKVYSLFEEFCNKHGIQYTGAIGGGIDYIFHPTSIGTFFKVKFEVGDAVEEHYIWDGSDF